MRRRLLGAAFVSVAALVLAGCGSSTQPGPVSTAEAVPTVAPPVESAVPAPAVEVLEVREYWDDGTELFGSYVGMMLDDARRETDALGLHADERDPDGDRAWTIIDSNWIVVGQDPTMGEYRRDGDYIDLYVMKADDPDADARIAENSADRTHARERRFTGIVTGYGSEEDRQATTVVVDEAILELDLIQPVPAGCDTSSGYASALAEKEQLIPVGARVLVERAERNRPAAYVHVIGDEVPPDGTFVGTANELLVRTGWWEPEDAFNGGLLGSTADVLFEPYAPATYWHDAREDYAYAIAKAGTETLPNAIGDGIASCRQIAETDQAVYAILEAEREREFERWYAEYQRRVASGYYSCRDGDGDGICNER